MKTLKISKKSLTKPKKGRGKSHSAKKLEGGTLLGFAFQGRGLWRRSKSSTEYFGKSESFTKSGTYAMNEKSDEKKLATVIVGLFSLEKRRLKNANYFK